MNVWCHLPTILGMRPNSFRRKRTLRFVVLFMICVALITTLFITITYRANAAANKTISFQGRLLDSFGGAVPNGHYNIQFKIYQGGSGNTAGNPDGTLVWTESYINNGSPTDGVQLKDGSFSVNLGSVTPFENSVDWNHDTIWLSMNVAGSAVNCTSFGSGSCTADGEMIPMKRMTATPYSMNSGAVGGKTASDLVQLGQGTQIDDRDGVSSISINKTGSGNLLQLQSSSTDVFTVTNNGNVILGGDSASISSTNSSTDGVDGGSLVIQGGDATIGNSNGGNIIINGGSGSGTGASGLVVINTPTHKTAEEQSCDADCAILQSNVDNNGAIALNAEVEGLTFTMPSPTIQTAGRTMYVTTATNSSELKLAINGLSGDEVTLTPGTTTTLFWNGNVWTIVGLPENQGIKSTNVDGIDSIQIGDQNDNSTTLLTVDKSDTAPSITDSALLGSMYYDTVIGKLQCYEATGWGDCGSSPDIFVTLSPEYTNAVTNGSLLGELTSGICSDTLSINDGSSSQPEICGANETYNFYNWTSSEVTAQTKSIYVNYQLPGSFQEFAEGAMSLSGRTDGSDASVDYQIYRNSGAGLIACGGIVAVSTGVQTSWQTANATGESDPADCGFSAGDSVVIKIDLTSSNDANAYVGNLGFVFSSR